ncbi:MAG: hypothetical protein NZ750_00715 [Anaerolineae bacterium]|nr:hypothetical protein [Anaerolineae bacterium]MDW8173106.1 hypothetical protein [Anaerolineae bacterium]
MARSTPHRASLSLLGSSTLVGLGLVLLLNSFMLLGEVQLGSLWPLALVGLGLLVLVRGDLAPNDQTRRFSITRGSVQSATLEISAGDVDVTLMALPVEQQERLVVGSFALAARPALSVNDTHALVRMDRAEVGWNSLAEWEVRLAQNVPWVIYTSTSTGQQIIDLSELVLAQAHLASGIGAIRLVLPREFLEGAWVQVRVNLAVLTISTPLGLRVLVQAQGRFLRLNADPARYQLTAEGWRSSADETLPLLRVQISGTFGDVRLV